MDKETWEPNPTPADIRLHYVLIVVILLPIVAIVCGLIGSIILRA